VEILLVEGKKPKIEKRGLGKVETRRRKSEFKEIYRD